MGTRTNFYKNPSHAYNNRLNLNSVLQNLKSYNIATGNAPPDEPLAAVQPKRRRVVRRSPPLLPPPPDVKPEDYDGPMSHHEYIEKRRKECDSSQRYQELTADVLENSSSAVNIVGYESDTSTSAESEEDQGPSNSEAQLDYSKEMTYFPVSASTEGADQIKTQIEQRFPAPGEPVCVVCGKYGEYICNESDDDICSMECKAELLQCLKLQQEPQNGQLPSKSLSARRCTLEVPESGGDTWDYDQHRWSKKISGLCTYECWKCGKPGHLAEDCLAIASHCESNASGKVETVRDSSKAIPRDLLDLYKRCHRIGRNFMTAKCNSCRGSTSLAACLSCDNTFCDHSGHLSEHIRGHPTHQRYYSYKLKRLVKCCKPSCRVTDIKDLLACHHCFDKAFDKFYDMYTASWKAPGLSIICNSICCDDHFEWHRMNCQNAGMEDTAYIFKNKQGSTKKSLQLSDFIF